MRSDVTSDYPLVCRRFRADFGMETITAADGTKVGWQTTGSGPPLLLVHGTTADHTRWAGITPRFERNFTVHAMDRRGRGSSTDDARAYDIMREAEDVAAVVEAIGEPANER
jgi:pimeloyl-ACP methyl ester carboxylesterase